MIQMGRMDIRKSCVRGERNQICKQLSTKHMNEAGATHDGQRSRNIDSYSQAGSVVLPHGSVQRIRIDAERHISKT